ncbi:hypothetical protein PPERSA_02488 [Pseudocohnilembus persalinus]|uniref:Transmembrane protein n=1 Tax=Pseudocohnilembus persalinus TaxID=266149 RepID=A0A0V0QB04_PSEPJ|nr:hypothetical protein PPERSA_02488 [Pseudocohnilembus persalinus]|eukprot:KRW99376.1 hypothetical protein PPERSA_02488 [Pseudocohnilembus persalinus]
MKEENHHNAANQQKQPELELINPFKRTPSNSIKLNNSNIKSIQEKTRSYSNSNNKFASILQKHITENQKKLNQKPKSKSKIQVQNSRKLTVDQTNSDLKSTINYKNIQQQNLNQGPNSQNFPNFASIAFGSQKIQKLQDQVIDISEIRDERPSQYQNYSNMQNSSCYISSLKQQDSQFMTNLTNSTNQLEEIKIFEQMISQEIDQLQYCQDFNQETNRKNFKDFRTIGTQPVNYVKGDSNSQRYLYDENEFSSDFCQQQEEYKKSQKNNEDILNQEHENKNTSTSSNKNKNQNQNAKNEEIQNQYDQNLNKQNLQYINTNENNFINRTIISPNASQQQILLSVKNQQQQIQQQQLQNNGNTDTIRGKSQTENKLKNQKTNLSLNLNQNFSNKLDNFLIQLQQIYQDIGDLKVSESDQNTIFEISTTLSLIEDKIKANQNQDRKNSLNPLNNNLQNKQLNIEINKKQIFKKITCYNLIKILMAVIFITYLLVVQFISLMLANTIDSDSIFLPTWASIPAPCDQKSHALPR